MQLFRYMGSAGDWGFPSYMLMWIVPFVLLDLILKGLALWRSSQRKEKWWFVALLLINSLGILPAIYLLTHPNKKK